jgi:hypothetical protein
MLRPTQPQEKATGTHWTKGWADPKTDLDDVEKRENLAIPGIKHRPLVSPDPSQSLSRLSYPGSDTATTAPVRGSRGTAANTFNLYTRWKWEVSFTVRPLFSGEKLLCRILGASQSRSGRCSKEKVFLASISASSRRHTMILSQFTVHVTWNCTVPKQ